jgi:hypothetical protein
MSNTRWVDMHLMNHKLRLSGIFTLAKVMEKQFFKKFIITYTGRIYKIFIKKKFIKMNFNRSHKIIYKYHFPGWFWRIIPFDKHLTCWMQLPYPFYNRIITKFIQTRPLNPYTWRGLQYSRRPWTKKPGKISEYV